MINAVIEQNLCLDKMRGGGTFNNRFFFERIIYEI